jgi:hypothetical protein
LDDKLKKYQDNMKGLFDKKYKDREFLPGDLVLKWEAIKEHAGKHGKSNHLCFRPFKIVAPKGKTHSHWKILMEKLLTLLSMGAI